MSSNFLDWERKFQKNRGKKRKFSIYEAIFINAIKHVQPVESRELLKKKIMETGLSEEEFILLFEILKRKKILQYTMKEPKGFYVEDEVFYRIDEEYKDPLELTRPKKVEYIRSTSKTIDSFLKIDRNILKIYEDLGITHKDMHQILDRWKKNQKNKNL
jgi:hypothetical protein